MFDEQHALVAAAARGVAVAPGTPFRVGDGGGPAAHVRVTVATIEQVDDDLVEALVAAGAPPGRRRTAV